MSDRPKTSIQRTLIVTMGEEGAAVGQHLSRMFEEWGTPPVIAVRHLDDDKEVAETEAIDAALQEISRLSHRPALGGLGYSPDRLEEVVTWVVGPPGAPMEEVSGLVAERAATLLGCDPLTMGLVLSPSPLPSLSSPLPGLSLLYVVGPVNEAGLTLDGADAIHMRAARFLMLHTCTPLRDTPAWVEQTSGWGNGMGYASFGLTWLAWPGDVAQAHAASWLAEAVVRQVMGDPDSAPDAEALLREAAWAPALLSARLSPSPVVQVLRLAAGDVESVAPWALLRPADGSRHPLLANLEALAGEWDMLLSDSESAWERAMQASIREVIEQVRDWVGQALDVGGFSGARALIEALERRFADWATGAEQRLGESQDDLEHIERDAQAVWEELASLLEHMPRLCVRELVRVLRSPLQWLRLYRRWRKAQGLHTRYNLLRAAGLETRVVIEQMKRVCGVYWAAGAELVSISEELDRLEHKVHEVLGTERELPDWPDLPLLLGDDPDTLLAQLTECHLPEMEEQAAYLLDHSGPLSKWWGNGLPHQKDISQWLKELVEPLATIPIGEVMRYRYPDPQAVAHWMDELAAQASPLWRWDPAALSEAERAHVGGATVILSALDGSVPWTEDDKSGWRCLPLARGDRLAVVALRWGIPCLKRDA